MGGPAVLAELAKACDDNARPATDADQVGGVPARFVAWPATTAEAAEVLRVAAQHRLYVVARGGATKLGWGDAPQQLDLLLDTTRLAGVVEHSAGDLVVVTRAGTRLDDLSPRLAEARQEMAFDSPVAGATVGGSVATSPSGPRRLLRGTLRDLLIGVTFVRSDGVVAKAGGKVVKNVAGYDFGKLLTGSYGTLGVITEAVFRLHPVPAARRFVTVEVADASRASAAMHAVLRSQAVPSAVEVDWPAGGSPSVSVLVEGTDDGVTERAAALVALLDAAPSGEQSPDWWGAYPFGPSDVGLKLSSEIRHLDIALAAAREAGERAGVAVAVRGSAAGVLHAGMSGDTAPGAVSAVVDHLRGRASSYGGGVVVLTAPPATRSVLDLWGPVPGLALMRRLKDELDPDHRLAPGRFVGGI